MMYSWCMHLDVPAANVHGLKCSAGAYLENEMHTQHKLQTQTHTHHTTPTSCASDIIVCTCAYAQLHKSMHCIQGATDNFHLPHPTRKLIPL